MKTWSLYDFRRPSDANGQNVRKHRVTILCFFLLLCMIMSSCNMQGEPAAQETTATPQTLEEPDTTLKQSVRDPEADIPEKLAAIDGIVDYRDGTVYTDIKMESSHGAQPLEELNRTLSETDLSECPVRQIAIGNAMIQIAKADSSDDWFCAVAVSAHGQTVTFPEPVEIRSGSFEIIDYGDVTIVGTDMFGLDHWFLSESGIAEEIRSKPGGFASAECYGFSFQIESDGTLSYHRSPAKFMYMSSFDEYLTLCSGLDELWYEIGTVTFDDERKPQYLAVKTVLMEAQREDLEELFRYAQESCPEAFGLLGGKLISEYADLDELLAYNATQYEKVS